MLPGCCVPQTRRKHLSSSSGDAAVRSAAGSEAGRAQCWDGSKDVSAAELQEQSRPLAVARACPVQRAAAQLAGVVLPLLPPPVPSS